MKKILFILVLLGIAITTLSSQRSRSRERDRRDSRSEENGLSENIWYGLSLGNLYFFNDFSISGKFQGGYKPIDRVSIGLQAKIYYDFINNIGDDYSLLSFGGGPEVRAKISDDFYAIGEFNFMSLHNIPQNRNVNARENLTYPSAGIGYQQGRGPWKFGAQLLFIFSEEARSPILLNRSVDYWIDFNYKF